jgi:HEAT repeat protein
VPALAEALRDANALVRQEAAHTLGCIGELTFGGRDASREAVPALVAALHDSVREVRRSAACALGRIPALGPDAVSDLVAVLGDDDPAVRRVVAWALGSIEKPGPDVVLALVEALHDQDGLVRGRAAQALRRLKAKEAVPALAEVLLRDPEAEVRATVAETLGQIGTEVREAVPTLIAVLGDKDSEVCRVACRALEQIGDAAAKAAREAAATADAAFQAVTPALFKLRDRHPSVIVRIQAQQGLERLGADYSTVPDAVVNASSILPPLSDKMRAEAAAARKQLHTFCLVGEILHEARIDTFVIGWMMRQLRDRMKLDIKATTLREHLEKVEKLFEKHRPELGVLHDRGRGVRGYAITPQWWTAWHIAMQTLGRTPPGG